MGIYCSTLAEKTQSLPRTGSRRLTEITPEMTVKRKTAVRHRPTDQKIGVNIIIISVVFIHSTIGVRIIQQNLVITEHV